jgi:hypothetical protein
MNDYKTITDYINNPPSGFQLQPIGPIATLRDQFAIAALSVLRELHPAPLRWKDVALTAYELADAMMEARK